MTLCRTRSALFALLAGALLLAPGPLFAQATRWVDDDAPNDPGPGDPAVSDPPEDGTATHPFDAIQEGIDAAVDGDTVLVLDGTYSGTGNRDIGFLGKAITVRSENGPAGCLVDMWPGERRAIPDFCHGAERGTGLRDAL